MTDLDANQIILQTIAESLDSTSQLVNSLLNEIKDSEDDFIAVKTELSILRDNVKSLSIIVREGNGSASLITKIALIQQKIESIEKWMQAHSTKHEAISVSYDSIAERLREIEDKINTIEKIIIEATEETFLKKVQKNKVPAIIACTLLIVLFILMYVV